MRVKKADVREERRTAREGKGRGAEHKVTTKLWKITTNEVLANGKTRGASEKERYHNAHKVGE